jgi:SAM-dependent MidA family methyltransferase
LLALQFAGWAANCPETQSATVTLADRRGRGARRRLARDLLEALGRWAPADLARLEYMILEPSGQREQWQRDTLGDLADRVRWVPTGRNRRQPGCRGVIFANELLDALPARRLGWDRTQAQVVRVGGVLDRNAFDWTRLPVDPELSPPVQAWLDDLATAWSVEWADGHTVEAPESALAWWSAAARSLR